MAHFFLHLKVLRQEPYSLCKLAAWKYHISGSVQSFVEAFRHGHVHGGKPSIWSDDLLSTFDSLVIWIAQTSALLRLFHCPLLQALCRAVDECSRDLVHSPHRRSLNDTFCLAYKNYAESLFNEAVTLHTPDDEFFMDYRKGSSLLQDASFWLRKSRPFLGNPKVDGNRGHSLTEGVRHLEMSVELQLCICEALQYIRLGDEALEKSLIEKETVEMGYVEDALDYYRSASRATKEMDMETEAMAMSRTGDTYAYTLKMEEIAHKFYFQGVRLALTVMSPRVSKSEWYKRSLKKVKEHQQRIEEKEKAERERSREPAMVRLKPRLSKLAMEAKRSAESFLRFLYAEHSHPELERNVVPVVNTKENVKKSLRKAILYYHPDNNVGYGKDWKVLCEEICKHLNSKYELLK